MHQLKFLNCRLINKPLINKMELHVPYLITFCCYSLHERSYILLKHLLLLHKEQEKTYFSYDS